MTVQPRDIKALLIAGCIFAALLSALAFLRGRTLDPAPVVENPNAPTSNVGYTRKVSRSFRITMPANAVVGQTVKVWIEVLGVSGGGDTGYTGVVSIKSDLLDLPDKSRFLPGDQGRHEYVARAIKPGTETIEVSDPALGFSSKSKPITVAPAQQETDQ